MLRKIYCWLCYISSGFLSQDRYSGKIVKPHIFLEQVNLGNVNAVEIGKLYVYAELDKPIGMIFKVKYLRTSAYSVHDRKEMEKLRISNKMKVLEGI